jgi:hypothetical protein
MKEKIQRHRITKAIHETTERKKSTTNRKMAKKPFGSKHSIDH